MTDVKTGKLDFGPKSGGDACCASPDSPEQELKHYLPKLNEVIFEFLSEDPNMAEGQHKGDKGVFQIKPEVHIQNICAFTQKCLGTADLPKLKVTLDGGVEGVPEGSDYKQGDLMTLKVTVTKPSALKQDACCLARLHWMVLTNSLSRETHFYEFRQIKDEMKHEFKS